MLASKGGRRTGNGSTINGRILDTYLQGPPDKITEDKIHGNADRTIGPYMARLM